MTCSDPSRYRKLVRQNMLQPRLGHSRKIFYSLPDTPPVLPRTRQACQVTKLLSCDCFKVCSLKMHLVALITFVRERASSSGTVSSLEGFRFRLRRIGLVVLTTFRFVRASISVSVSGYECCNFPIQNRGPVSPMF